MVEPGDIICQFVWGGMAGRDGRDLDLPTHNANIIMACFDTRFLSGSQHIAGISFARETRMGHMAHEHLIYGQRVIAWAIGHGVSFKF